MTLVEKLREHFKQELEILENVKNNLKDSEYLISKNEILRQQDYITRLVEKFSQENTPVEEKPSSELSANYLSVVEPYFYIHIGIKNDEVVKVDWSEMLLKSDKFACTEDIKTTVAEYLNKAKQYLECKIVGETDEKF